jgi:hypothetical protein
LAWTAGFATISPGASRWQSFTWGSNPGAQHIVPNPLNPGGFLRIDELSKKLETNGSVTYVVVYTNVGSVATNVNFQGGGVT